LSHTVKRRAINLPTYTQNCGKLVWTFCKSCWWSSMHLRHFHLSGVWHWQCAGKTDRWASVRW